jgi:hypothetical protein
MNKLAATITGATYAHNDRQVYDNYKAPPYWGV